MNLTPLWKANPNFVQNSRMHAFMQWVNTHHGLSLQGYDDLWQWSVDNIEAFWESIWQFFAVKSHSPYQQVLQRPEEGMIGTKWFEGATLNYAEHVFRNATTDHPAIIFQAEGRDLDIISWAELERRVNGLANWMRKAGIEKGDRVVAYLPNIPQAVVGFLAANSLGAIWSSCSPDFGTASVVDRFQQIEPKLLIATDGYRYNGKAYNRLKEVEALEEALPTLENVLLVPFLDPDALPISIPKASLWAEALSVSAGPLEFLPVEFDHPLWVLYSSGTTGKPKAITHSVGGNLIEHLKALGLHHDCKPGQRLFWYSTTGWMMWNFCVAAMLHGTTMMIYDGSAAYPDLNVLWDFAKRTRLQHFGGGASFYINCMKQGMAFSEGELPELLSIGSTGSPLPPEAFEWIYKSVKKDVWLASISGGTDVCSGFVGGSPFLPVYAGEIQCRMLGCKVEAYDENAVPVIGQVGEMVISEPMPSMPVYFWNDPDNTRYRSSYFEHYPNVWRHGDWIRVSDEGTIVIYGRSDATLNRGGVRIGTSEVYRGVDGIPEITDSLVISVERPDGSYFMPLFVVLRPGERLTESLQKNIRKSLRTQFSPRHVPDEIIAVPEIPYTISGKKMEAPVKKILMGVDPANAISKDAMKNPESISFFIQFANE
ncbi:MAG: acetoacetate--CoA ligase [Bacteroidia bacterium]